MSGTLNSTPRGGGGGGLSLYANLLESDTKQPEIISKGPIVHNPPPSSSEPKKPQIDPAALRFQPTKRPQLSQKTKPRPSIPKPASIDPNWLGNSSPSVVNTSTNTGTTKLAKSTLADWTADRDEDTYYATERRQRGGRKKKKKNKEQITIQDWDDIYDPNRPNNFEEYKNSDEKIHEVREWKERLNAHRMQRRDPSGIDSEEEETQARPGHIYAPPPDYNFAPPPPIDVPLNPSDSNLPNSQPERNQLASLFDKPVSPPASLSTQIARAPVLYTQSSTSQDKPASDDESIKSFELEVEEDQKNTGDDTQRSRRPGQKKFAERLMSKYGWSKGKGLGAEESGIIDPLQVKLEKRKKKSDAEGGGFRDAGNRGKIIGGRLNANSEKDQDCGKFGPMSELILLNGMVNGTDLDEEIQRGSDGDLVQEIGDECAEKYGRVERVFINRTGETAGVFVKFTSQLSALRAVNALEGRIFNGKTITARFFDTDKFEAGDYE